jgi:hypothetical protein
LLPRSLHRSALAGWALGSAIGEVAGGAEARTAAEAFRAWGADGALGAALRDLGASDAEAWRAAELARALLVIPEDEAPAGVSVGEAGPGGEPPALPDWLDDPAVRAAAGWNEWQGRRYIAREAWDELIDVVAARDTLLGRRGAEARALARKAAAARRGYEVD